MLEHQRARVLRFVALLLILEQAHAFSITSWARTPTRNRIKGGRPTSYHLDWCAVDAVPEPEVDRVAFTRACFNLGLEAYDEGDHVHIELDWRKLDA